MDNRELDLMIHDARRLHQPLDEWLVPPFEGAIIDYPPYGESVVARGIDNSKGPLVCFLNAVDSIRQVLGHLPVNILFVIEGEEELGSESLAAFVKVHAQELSTLDGVFLNGTRQDEKGRPFTILGNKGVLYLELACTGGDWGGPREDQHSMDAAWCGSPAWRLVNALNSMRDKDDNILIKGFYDDLRPLSPADEALTRRMADVFDQEMYLHDRLTADKFMKNLSGEAALRHLLWQPTLNIDGIWSGYTGPAYLFTQPPVSIPFVSYGLGVSGREHAPNEWMTVKSIRENEMSSAAFLYYLAKLAARETNA